MFLLLRFPRVELSDGCPSPTDFQSLTSEIIFLRQARIFGKVHVKFGETVSNLEKKRIKIVDFARSPNGCVGAHLYS